MADRIRAAMSLPEKQGQQNRMMELKVVRGGDPGWICQVALSMGHHFWLAGYNGWVSPLTFGSKAAAGAEVQRLEAALRGEFVKGLAAEVTPWTISEDSALSREDYFSVFSVGNRYLADRVAVPRSLIVFNAEFSNSFLVDDEADLVRVVGSLGLRF